MRCISPITLKRDGVISHVPCGRCFACLSNRRKSWLFRLREEQKKFLNSFFVTLTYSDENLPIDNCVPHVSSRDLQLFFKRLRHSVKKTLTYYAVSEYGCNTLRPHYHAIIFCDLDSETFLKCLKESWKLGFVYLGKCNAKTINYVTKYVTLRTRLPEIYSYGSPYAPFTRCSKGLGISFLTPQMVSYMRSKKDYLITVDGKRSVIPRYYRDKVFSKLEKAVMKNQFEKFFYVKFQDLFSKLSDDEIMDYVRQEENAIRLFMFKSENNLYKNRKL